MYLLLHYIYFHYIFITFCSCKFLSLPAATHCIDALIRIIHIIYHNEQYFFLLSLDAWAIYYLSSFVWAEQVSTRLVDLCYQQLQVDYTHVNLLEFVLYLRWSDVLNEQFTLHNIDKAMETHYKWPGWMSALPSWRLLASEQKCVPCSKLIRS